MIHPRPVGKSRLNPMLSTSTNTPPSRSRYREKVLARQRYPLPTSGGSRRSSALAGILHLPDTIAPRQCRRAPFARVAVRNHGPEIDHTCDRSSAPLDPEQHAVDIFGPFSGVTEQASADDPVVRASV